MSLQVSAQTQAPEAPPNGGADGKIFAKTGKKKLGSQLGAFAKLLDGLAAKTESATMKQTAANLKTPSKAGKKENPLAVALTSEQKKAKKTPAEKSLLDNAGAAGILAANPAQDKAAKAARADVKKQPPQTETIQAKTADAGLKSGAAIAGNAGVSATAAPKPDGAAEGANAAKGAKADLKVKREPAGQNAQIAVSLATNFQADAAKTVRQADDKTSAVKTEDARSAKAKRRDRATVEVQDGRTASAQEQARTPVVQSAADAKAAELTVDLRGGHAQDMPEIADKNPRSQNFAEMLSLRLNDNLAGDIVRQAAIVLNDGGQGTIKLSLKPETLGNVKIRLEMAENKITGHIIVDSEEALRAFEKEVHTLEQAFKDSGFESATLDANLASDNGQSGRQRDGDARPYFSERFAAGAYDDIELRVAGSYGMEAQASVNMLA